MSVSTNKDIVIYYIERVLDKSITGLLMEPDTDNRIIIAIGNALQTLQDTFRVEVFTMPKVTQDKEDPTRIIVEFSFVPGRDFDWTIDPKTIHMHFTVSTLGVSQRNEERNLNATAS